MKINKFLTVALALCLALCLVPFSASAGSCDACMDADNNRICDICAECVGKCIDYEYDGNHNCDRCGRENATVCADRFTGLFLNHVCTDCRAIQPTCDVLTTDHCEGCGAFQLTEANFPDANFRNYLINDHFGSDAPLSALDVLSCTNMRYAYGKDISDLTGIELFTALQLLDCSENNLTHLDLSKNTALRELHCNHNDIPSLDLSNNTALVYLRCNSTNLTSLDLSKNTALQELYCDFQSGFKC